jgi:hypothetical protein
MSRKLALALSVLAVALLAGFGSCGGGHTGPYSPFGCSLQIRGGASEDLWCFPASYDFTQIPPAMLDGGIPDGGWPDGGFQAWAFEIAAYRGSPYDPTGIEVGAGIGVWFEGPPVVGTTYGFQPDGSTILAGGAERYVGLGLGSIDGGMTHEARSPLAPGDVGAGNLSMRFTQLPVDGGLPIDVHGVVDATLPAVDGGSNVTFHAAF